MFPKYEASCKSSAERNEVIYISLTLYIQLFLFSIESLFISASLSWARAHWGMQNASCGYSSACEELCLAKWVQDFSEGLQAAVAFRNGLKKITRYSSVLRELQGFHAEVPLLLAKRWVQLSTDLQISHQKKKNQSYCRYLSRCC